MPSVEVFEAAPFSLKAPKSLFASIFDSSDDDDCSSSSSDDDEEDKLAFEEEPAFIAEVEVTKPALPAEKAAGDVMFPSMPKEKVIFRKPSQVHRPTTLTNSSSASASRPETMNQNLKRSMTMSFLQDSDDEEVASTAHASNIGSIAKQKAASVSNSSSKVAAILSQSSSLQAATTATRIDAEIAGIIAETAEEVKREKEQRYLHHEQMKQQRSKAINIDDDDDDDLDTIPRAHQPRQLLLFPL